MAGLAVLADDLPGALELLGKALVRSDDLIEGVGDLAGQTGLVARQPDREITVADRLQGPKEFADVQTSGTSAVSLPLVLGCGACVRVLAYPSTDSGKTHND